MPAIRRTSCAFFVGQGIFQFLKEKVYLYRGVHINQYIVTLREDTNCWPKLKIMVILEMSGFQDILRSLTLSLDLPAGHLYIKSVKLGYHSTGFIY